MNFELLIDDTLIHVDVAPTILHVNFDGLPLVHQICQYILPSNILCYNTVYALKWN